MERKVYTPPYRPQSNGRIECFHNFLKACLSKHISRHREGDDVTPLAMASYNWLPNQHFGQNFQIFTIGSIVHILVYIVNRLHLVYLYCTYSLLSCKYMYILWKVVGSRPQYRFSCLIHKTMPYLHGFTSVFLFQHRSTWLHHNSLISTFQLVFSHVFAHAGGHLS